MNFFNELKVMSQSYWINTFWAKFINVTVTATKADTAQETKGVILHLSREDHYFYKLRLGRCLQGCNLEGTKS